MALNKLSKYSIIPSSIISILSLSVSSYLFSRQPRIAFVHNDRLLLEYVGVKEARQKSK